MCLITIDLRRELKHLYSPKAQVCQVVDVPALGFLMIDGQGAPEGEAFQACLQSLYSAAYTLKFMMKKHRGVDYQVMPLEGLWWSNQGDFFVDGVRDEWQWTLMMAVPDIITPAQLNEAVLQAQARGSKLALDSVRVDRLAEGPCAQVMHIGSYSAEPATIRRLHDYIESQGYSLRGLHHEIYLGDPRRSAPDKLRTIIRHPIVKAS